MQDREDRTIADAEAGPVGRLLESVRGVLATLLAIGRTRLELLSVEAQIEMRRMAEILVLGMAALYAAGAAVLMLGISVILAFWDTHRVLAAVLVGVTFLVIAALAAVQLRRKLRTPSAFLAGTFSELARDLDQLRSQR